MKRLKKRYDEGDVICSECIEDDALRKIIQSDGCKAKCALCKRTRVGVTIKELAKIVDPIIRKHYRQGEFVRRYGPADDDRHWEEQRGEDLYDVLQEILGQHLGCLDALISSLEAIDPYDPRGGEEPYYDRTTNYEAIPVYIGELYKEWNAISDELRSRRRFFSDRARNFFDWLFEGLENLWSYAAAEELAFAHPKENAKSTRVDVVSEWPAGKLSAAF